jgi:outer membrane protein TolC
MKKLVLAVFILLQFSWSAQAADSLTVEQCVSLALKQSPELKKAQANLSLAGASLQGSLGTILPHLSANSIFSQRGPVTIDQNGHYDTYSTGLNVGMSLVNLSGWADITGTALARQSAGAAYQLAVASLAYRVKEAFYGLAKLEKAVEVARSSVKQSQEQSKRAEAMFQLGSLSRADMLKIQVRLTQNRVDLLSAESNLLTARQSLAGLLGISGEAAINPNLELPDTTLIRAVSDSVTPAELEQNPAYRLADKNRKSKKAGLWAAWLDKLPYLSGSYSYGYSDSRQFKDNSDWIDRDSWSTSLSLNWNIFDGGISASRIRQAAAQLKTADADLFSSRQAVYSELKLAKLSLAMSREAIGLVADLLQQASEDYKLTTEKYRLGSASVLDLLSSQLTYNQAQQQAANTLCDYYLSLARLDKALGKW